MPFLKRLAKQNRGFTLIEEIIGISLIAVVIVVLWQSLSVGINTSDRTRDRATLFNLAQSQLEDILKQDYQTSHIYTSLSPIPEGYSVAVTVTVPVTYTYPSPGTGNAPETIQSIQVTVTGDYGSATVYGYKVRQ